MTNYAELLGIDLVKLEAERYYHYQAPGAQYFTNDRTPQLTYLDDWEKVSSAARAVGRSVRTVRRWVKSDFVMAKKDKTAIYVYMPDVLRHAKR